MAKLSQKQIDAINAIDSDVEIIACAGAGKTGVVTRRIINILKCNQNITPENIVAFTFTRKAAEELKTRIYSIGKAELEIQRASLKCILGQYTVFA